ncbi:hypothetical protein C1H46_007954 [Malus baccata]|uniref:Uncharacterized protein n=1 Tax=Malus baccata TaxID=106549 RepID=A0A540N5Y4_MALBA|nr:hypothetical protein C1H46_007954 [Malus baccata]
MVSSAMKVQIRLNLMPGLIIQKCDASSSSSRPEEERNKVMVNHKMFLKQMVNKLEKENRELEIWMAMNQFIAGKPLTDLQFTDLKETRRMIKEKLKEFEAKIKSWKEELAKMNQLLGAQPVTTVAGENIQNALQMVPWSMWDVPTKSF